MGRVRRLNVSLDGEDTATVKGENYSLKPAAVNVSLHLCALFPNLRQGQKG